jgi:UDP-N-acetylmuramate dehydrogenase
MAAAYTLAWDASLRGRNTFRVDARAHCLATVHAAEALPELLEEPALRGLPLLVLGEGSNVLFTTDRFDGLVVHLACDAARVTGRRDGHASVLVEAAFGWDALVEWTLGQGLQGLENLALIPGQVGAAPIQNIGAYGVEVAEFVAAVHAFDCTARRPVRIDASACAFGYRDSVFKRQPGQWIVTAVELRLPTGGPTKLGYAGVREELEAMGGLAATPRNVADAVRRIRRRKLPDPTAIGNAGSFFKNPIVPAAIATQLRTRFDSMPVYPAAREDERKLSAAWLIEQAGWRGYREGDAGISAQHALVLVNHGRASGADLLAVAHRVAASVEHEFGVALEPEPRVVGAVF